MTFTDTTLSVVLGGTSGIGRAVADALSSRPGTVYAVGRRTGLDISDPVSVAEYFSTLGPVDHVIVTAGSQAPSGTVRDVAITDAKHAFETKFWGSILVSREAARVIRPGGTLTLTSGFLARRPIPGTYVKTAMNAALEAVTKVLARELAPLRVNAVSPGLTDTEAYAGLSPDARAAMLDRARSTLPVGRYGTPADLARAYLFAIDTPFITGSVIDVEGGALIS